MHEAHDLEPERSAINGREPDETIAILKELTQAVTIDLEQIKIAIQQLAEAVEKKLEQ